MSTRVIITGMGVISSLGNTLGEFWERCLKGESVVESIPTNWRQFADFRSTLWAPLLPLDALSRGLRPFELKQYDPVSTQAVCAALEAVEHAGLRLKPHTKRINSAQIEGLASERAGVFVGVGVGGASSASAHHSRLVLSRISAELGQLAETTGLSTEQRALVASIRARVAHPSSYNPFVVPRQMINGAAAALARKLSITGPNQTTPLACAAGTVAIGHAFHAVRSGAIDLALAGGSEFLRDEYGTVFHGFDVARTLVRSCDRPSEANRPFDRDRSGFLFSQGGAAILVLERLDRALARGAPIVAEIVGAAESFDPLALMGNPPDLTHGQRMILDALADAGLEAGDIGYINAHATGTEANDASEAALLRQVFGSHVPVNSTKSLLGHTIGASGAIEAVVTAQSLHHQKTHASLNLVNPIEELDFVLDPRALDAGAALSHSFAFGGHNAGLILRRVTT